MRTYRLLRMGLRLDEIDDSSALRNDWLLAIDDEYRKAEAEAEAKRMGAR